MKRRPLGLSTRAIHGDLRTRADWTPVAAPLQQSSTFTNPVGSSAEVLYTRYGNNPNQVAIARRLALLEGAEAAIFVASGMGAIALAHLAVLRPGDHLVSSKLIYGGVRRLFTEEFGRLGIEVTFVDPFESRDWKRAMRKTTRAVFLETPTNPLLRVVDLPPADEEIESEVVHPPGQKRPGILEERLHSCQGREPTLVPRERHDDQDHVGDCEEARNHHREDRCRPACPRQEHERQPRR